MTREEQLARFAAAIDATCEHFGKEFDITGVEAAGVLFCKASGIAANVNRPVPPKPKQDGLPG